MYPEFFYKYRSISKKFDEIADDHAIQALFKSYGNFSGRKNFNDLFDSKIDLAKPTPQQFKALRNHIHKAQKHIFDGLTKSGKFTQAGHGHLNDLEQMFNELIDSYAVYSLSAKATSNLMWAHYADSHRGFCIEFRSQYIQALPVTYSDNIAKLEMIDLFRLQLSTVDENELGKKVVAALRVKLKEWSYEDEYRYLANDENSRIPAGKLRKEVYYQPEFVEAIIFGCRMEERVKRYIIQNMPYPVKYKQAQEGMSTVNIVDSDLA
ncbi:DUF2971 domain-containing protein [Collimonas fungivorans]|uniref:DUF2971 domain-containing protein n=1 Tax=Collimonas fungivorans TaxID=158899 RepID=UPI00167FDB7B|nr:DUF2971 domain-containing protein [Collimonas fungivorans]